MISSVFAEECAYALMAEVGATPKPGLVDRHDSGAHTDMDYDTFAASTTAIVPYLARMFEAGYTWESKDFNALFESIRPIGIEAEKAMFAATDGVNTHKGMIFSMGTIAAAAGLFYKRHEKFDAEKILILAGYLCHDAMRRDFQKIDRKNPRTNGELLYLRYSTKGIRGEAQKGFPSVRTVSLPKLRSAFSSGQTENEAYLNTLLTLMANVDDTNVLSRTNMVIHGHVKSEAAQLLRIGGASTALGMEALKKLNQKFIHMNVSPGGCADLLAVTILLYRLEQSDR